MQRGLSILMGSVVSLLVLSACGGGSAKVSPPASTLPATPVNATPARVFEISKVVAAMSTVETAGWAGVGGIAKNESGVIDYANDYMTVHSTSREGVDLAMLRRGSSLYVNGGPTGQWCLAVQSASLGKTNPSFPTLVDAIALLRKNGASVQYLGPEMIRGVATSHFRSHAARTYDVWVDGRDRLRRISGQTSALPGLPGAPTSFAEDFFDFGVSVHFNPPTTHAPRCERDSTVP